MTSSASKKGSVTQKDIARAAGVSPTVVSYVINDGPRPVNEETRRRVLQAIEELGYRPNRFAQQLKSRGLHQAQRQIGIIMGGQIEVFQRSYYGDILTGIYDEAYRQGQRIRFIHFFGELHDPILFNEHVHPEEVSSLIFFPPHFFQRDPKEQKNEELLQRILRKIENVVCLDEAIHDLPSVLFDRISAARTAVSHLVGLQHRRVGFVGARDDRVDGYRQALFENGLQYDDDLVKTPGRLNSPEDGYSGAVQLLDIEPRPTAIFAACDEVAVGILGALRDRGIAVPDDIALVSIDDIELASIVRPALTTVRVPRRQMGVHALRILALHEAYPDTHPASTVLHTELIVRQSCGAKPA
jgi:LacI family transcriptional regulator